MVRSSSFGAEPPWTTSEVSGRMTVTERQPPAVSTWVAARTVLQVTVLLFAGTYGVMYLVGFALWLYWR